MLLNVTSLLYRLRVSEGGHSRQSRVFRSDPPLNPLLGGDLALVRTHAVKCLFVFWPPASTPPSFSSGKLVERMSFGGSLFLHVIEAADELLVRTFQRRFGVDAVEPRRIDQREEQVAEFAFELLPAAGLPNASRLRPPRSPPSPCPTHPRAAASRNPSRRLSRPRGKP